MKLLFTFIDALIKYTLGPILRFVRKNFIIFSSAIFIFLSLLIVVNFFYSRSILVGSYIKKDLHLIDKLLAKIDKDCDILSINADCIVIDFFNTKSFVGSQVGEINLAHPEKWQGPYSALNPTLKGKFYRLLKAKDGYFIIPPDGIALPDGSKIGRDIVFNADMEIAPLIKENEKRSNQGNVYALPISFEIGDWDEVKHSEDEDNGYDDSLDVINEAIKEFNDAMPFSANKNHRY